MKTRPVDALLGRVQKGCRVGGVLLTLYVTYVCSCANLVERVSCSLWRIKSTVLRLFGGGLGREAAGVLSTRAASVDQVSETCRNNLLPDTWPVRNLRRSVSCTTARSPHPSPAYAPTCVSLPLAVLPFACAVLQRVHGARQHLPLPRGARQGHRKDPTGSKLKSEPCGAAWEGGRVEGRPFSRRRARLRAG